MNTIVQTLAEKREYVKGKIIIGIDPAKGQTSGKDIGFWQDTNRKYIFI